MLNLLVQSDDSIDILLYGEPDPWLSLFQCNHDIYIQGPPSPFPGWQPPPTLLPHDHPEDEEDDSDGPQAPPSPFDDPPDDPDGPQGPAHNPFDDTPGAPGTEDDHLFEPGGPRHKEWQQHQENQESIGDDYHIQPSPDNEDDPGSGQNVPGSSGQADTGGREDEPQLTAAESEIIEEGENQGLSKEEIERRLQQYRQSDQGTLARVQRIIAQADPGDVAALESIADSDQGQMPITYTDAAGVQQQTTLGEYIREMLIPDTEQRVAVDRTNTEINAASDEGDVVGLQAIADDPERGNLPVTIYSTDDNGERIPQVGEDGQPALDADGNPVYETETITMAEYIRNYSIPAAEWRTNLSSTAEDLGLPPDATVDQVNAEITRLQQGGDPLPGSQRAQSNATSSAFDSLIGSLSSRNYAQSANPSWDLSRADEIKYQQQAQIAQQRIDQLIAENPELAEGLSAVGEFVGTSSLAFDGKQNKFGALNAGLDQLAAEGNLTNESIKDLVARLEQARSDAGNRPQNSYLRYRVDGSGNVSARWETYDDDDGGNGGAGGGGGGRQYTVADDGTVKYTEDGHTYTANDDLAEDVREAFRTGDASTLSTVDRVSVSDNAGNVITDNFTPTVAPEFSRENIAQSMADLLAQADRMGIGYDPNRPNFDAIRADIAASTPLDQLPGDTTLTYTDGTTTTVRDYQLEVQRQYAETFGQDALEEGLSTGQMADALGIKATEEQRQVNEQNREYVNFYLGEGTVPQGTHPTQEQIDQASAVASDVESLQQTAAPGQARVAADIGAQNREYVNFYLGEGTVPQGTHPTQEQIDQASAVASDVESLQQTAAPGQARVAADIGAQNREYVNFYLGEGTVPQGTHPTQEQIDQASAVASDVESLQRTAAPSQARVAADIGAQNREYVNFYLGEGTVPQGTHPTQEQIDQASAVASDVESLQRTAAPSQARVAADIGAQNREYVNFYLGEGTVPQGTHPTQEQIDQAGAVAAEQTRLEQRLSQLDGQVANARLNVGANALVVRANRDESAQERLETLEAERAEIAERLYGPDWRRIRTAEQSQQILDESTVATANLGPVWDAARAIGTGQHVSQYDSDISVPINLGLAPVAGTALDVGVRGRDGYSRGDLAWIAGGAALDVLPLPGPGQLARAGRAGLVVARRPGPALQIVTGGRRTLQSELQGTLKAPYELAGTRNKPAGVSNIPVTLGQDVIIDGRPVSAWEGLLYQRDRAFEQYRQTGIPQAIEVPTVGGGTQVVYVGGSRVGMETGRGASVHTSGVAGSIAQQSTDPGGAISRFKTHDKTGMPLPEVEQRFFVTTTGSENLVEGAAFKSQREPISGPGFIELVDPQNVVNVDRVRKVFGGNVDTGVMRPTAVVELEAGVPAGQRIAGGDGVPLYQERPVGLQQVQGETVYRYVDLPPAEQAGRITVLRSNVLAAIDNARGRTDNFYVVQRDADGVEQAFRQADLDELARQGVDPDDALRVEGRFGETRLISRSEWERGVGRATVGGGNRESEIQRRAENHRNRSAGGVSDNRPSFANRILDGRFVDPATGRSIDPTTGRPADPTTGRSIDPTTGRPADPTTGRSIDPTTGRPADPTTGRSIDPTTGRPADPTTGRSIDPTIGRPADPTTGRSIDPTTGRPADPTTGRSIDPTIGRPADPTTGRSIDPTIGRPADPTTGRSIDPTIGRPADPTTGRSIDPTTGRPVDPTTGRSIDPTTGRPVDPTTGRSIDPTTGRPVDPTTGRSIDPTTGRPVDPIRPERRAREELNVPERGRAGLQRRRPGQPRGKQPAPVTNDGPHPRIVAHREVVDVYTDIDTGDVRTELVQQVGKPRVVGKDRDAPATGELYSGNLQIKTGSRGIRTAPVQTRQRKAGKTAGKKKGKRPHQYEKARRSIQNAQRRQAVGR